MTTETPDQPREKLLVNLMPKMRRDLKIRAAEHGVNVQDAVAHALGLWYAAPATDAVPLKDAKSWGVFLPAGGPARFEGECDGRRITKVQGMAQAVTLWLDAHPSPEHRLVSQPVQRILIANQKGGVGKTFITAGVGQALAEMGLRVLLVDYDPQGHLSARLQVAELPMDGDSLLTHMLGKAKTHLARSIIALDGERFGGRLHILPASEDAFLMDAELASMRAGRDTCLARALAPVEGAYDVVLLDGPPNLGLGLDLAIDYVQRRPGELMERSGVLVPVWADKSSFRAYKLLNGQIVTQCERTGIVVDQLGIIVNAYDSRKGTVTRSFYDAWNQLTTPGVLAHLKDSVEGRESSDYEIPLLEYAPDSPQAETMRAVAKELAA